MNGMAYKVGSWTSWLSDLSRYLFAQGPKCLIAYACLYSQSIGYKPSNSECNIMRMHLLKQVYIYIVEAGTGGGFVSIRTKLFGI